MNDRAENDAGGTTSNLSDWFVLLPMDDVAYGKNPDMKSDELELISRAADDVLYAIAQGMAAIAELQWLACTNENHQPDISTFLDLGTFQKSLAELVERLHMLSRSADFRVHQRELAAKVTEAA